MLREYGSTYLRRHMSDRPNGGCGASLTSWINGPYLALLGPTVLT